MQFFLFLNGIYRPDKLLFHIGNAVRRTGSAEGELCWPRGLAVNSSGEIIIADTQNHRIQSFNQYGVVTKKLGKLGTREGEFNEPTGIHQLPIYSYTSLRSRAKIVYQNEMDRCSNTMYLYQLKTATKIILGIRL